MSIANAIRSSIAIPLRERSAVAIHEMTDELRDTTRPKLASAPLGIAGMTSAAPSANSHRLRSVAAHESAAHARLAEHRPKHSSDRQ